MVRNRTTRFLQRLSSYLQVKGFSWSWPKGIFHSQAVWYGESQLVSACNNFHSSVNFMVSVISLSLSKYITINLIMYVLNCILPPH
jgi:hypothetical protein